MHLYGKKKRYSGVVAFSMGDDFILCQFANNLEGYIYNYESAGIDHVEEMKRLALEGEGLTTYIREHQPRFFGRLKVNPIP